VSKSDPERRGAKIRKLHVRSDGSHHPDEKPATGVPGASATVPDEDLFDTPAYALGLSDPHVLERFEALDDAVFEAIAGKASGIDHLRRLWAEIPEIVGPQLVEESRQAYLLHALNKWSECNSAEEHRNPRLAATLLDVIAVLVGPP
jgi:hypothetical protein